MKTKKKKVSPKVQSIMDKIFDRLEKGQPLHEILKNGLKKQKS